MDMNFKREAGGAPRHQRHDHTIVRVPKSEPPLESSSVYPGDRSRNDRDRFADKKNEVAVPTHRHAAYAVF